MTDQLDVVAPAPPDSEPVGVSLESLLSAARVTVVAGKGGVGKTTVTAVLATAAAAAGLRVLVVELDGKPALGELVGDVPLLQLSARLALEEYLRDHGLGRIARRLSASGVIDVVATAAPGIDDIVVLGKIKQLERSGDWDVIVVDGPAAGHAVTLLTSAAGLQNAVSSGPVRTQADEVLAMLRDPDRLQVCLVTLPETTPVNETVETAFALEDRIGVRLAPVIVNSIDPDIDGAGLAARVAALRDGPAGPDGSERAMLAAAASFRDERRAEQRAAIGQLRERIAVGQIHIPQRPSAHLSPDDVRVLAISARARSGEP